jgi:type I restriction enzyme S subunit
MSKENKLIPELRFPEFENDREWVEEPLSSKVSVIDGDRGLNYPKAEEYSSDGYCLFLSAKNVTKSGFVFNEFQFITKEKDELLRKGKLSRFDIVLTTRGSLGQFAFFDENIQFENIRINSGMVILRAKDNRINPNYLYSYFNSNSIQSAIKSQGFGNAVQQLTVAVINNFTLRYPYAPKEQQKIASCLSFLDEIIATHSQKLNLLKDHKKGMMQNLFPQEGEKVPKYRFKEFENDGEWVEKKLNYYLELLTDFEANGSFADVKANVNVFDEPNYAWYVRATDLEKKSNSDSIKYVDEHSYNFLNKTKLLGGELLITKRGEIGKVYMYKPFKELPATVAPNLYLLKLNEKAEPKFFYFHFTNTIGNQSLKRLNASSTIGALYKDDVKNISVFVPSLKEQQKIASCLYSLDALITAQTERIEQLKLHKKGLMQGLFPKIEI